MPVVAAEGARLLRALGAQVVAEQEAHHPQQQVGQTRAAGPVGQDQQALMLLLVVQES